MAVSRPAAVLPEAFDLFWLNFHKLARHMCSNSGVAALEDIISVSVADILETKQEKKPKQTAAAAAECNPA